jgi:23S rRNA (guanosine2251-2'-O)-methyltransferase
MREILYGRQPVREALRSRRRDLFRVVLAEGGRGGVLDEIVALAEQVGVPVETAGRRRLDEFCPAANHQGVILEVSGYPYLGLADLLIVAHERGESPLLLVLDHLQDPQNLGSLLRSAEVAGAHGAVLPQRRAAGVTPAVVRASAGASEHLAVAGVTNIAQTLTELQAAGLWIAGLEGIPEANPLYQADLTGPLALVVGGEGQGLARLVRERCDFLLRLPVRGQVDSLNAAIAGAVALYEARRQRDWGAAQS